MEALCPSERRHTAKILHRAVVQKTLHSFLCIAKVSLLRFSNQNSAHLFEKVKQSRYTPCSAWKERRYSSYSFSTSALDGGEWSASRPGRAFTPGERTPCTHCTGGWVGPRAGLDTEDRGKILCPRRGSNPDRPVVQPVVRHYTD
jgi:hypothetical protein